MKWQTYLIILTLTIFCKKNTKLNKYNKLLWVYNILKKALLYSFIFKKIKRRIYSNVCESKRSYAQKDENID